MVYSGNKHEWFQILQLVITKYLQHNPRFSNHAPSLIYLNRNNHSSRFVFCGVPMLSGPWFSIKMPSYQYRKTHCGYKTILRTSYLHNGIFHTCKMTSLYWIGAQVPIDFTHIVGDYFSDSDGATLQIPHCQWSSNEQCKNVSKWRTYSVCHRTTTKTH